MKTQQEEGDFSRVFVRSFSSKSKHRYHDHHWAAVVFRCWPKASACHLQVLACLALPSTNSCPSSIYPGRLANVWLVYLALFSCPMISKW